MLIIRPATGADLPAIRGLLSDYVALGVGRALITRVMDEARARGYREMRLDTLPVMGEAQAIYEAFGFRDIEPY